MNCAKAVLARSDLRRALWAVCVFGIASIMHHAHTSKQQGVADAGCLLLVTACNTLSERYAQNLHDPVQQPVNNFKA